MAISTATSLQQVADSCRLVADNVTNLDREHPHVLRKVTKDGELPSDPKREFFTFTSTVYLDGKPYKVTVQKL